jgi:3'-phosphoadenosine 5'-phosphosulfate sulfotransferase (PAPS reductase)/FAD synthetase
MKWGFPGPSGHNLIYRYLKERALRQLIRELKTHRGDKVLLVTGVRLQESRRRMGHVAPFQKDGAIIWVAPILNWDNKQKNEYIATNDLKRNEVVAHLCMSGECLCGAFAKKDEIKNIEFWYPDAAKRIHDLEDKARAAGLPCVWGQRPHIEDEAQMKLDFGLCWSCPRRTESEVVS